MSDADYEKDATELSYQLEDVESGVVVYDPARLVEGLAAFLKSRDLRVRAEGRREAYRDAANISRERGDEKGCMDCITTVEVGTELDAKAAAQDPAGKEGR